VKHYIGIDIGTSGCKALAFDESAQQVTAAYREYDIVSPQPGWAELNGDEVIDKCFAVIREAAEQLPPRSICGLGIASQGEAFTPLDCQGNALANALVSSDTRAADYAENWSAQFGSQKLYQITGHTSHPMFSLFKLLWLKDNRPDIWSQTDKFLCFEDLLQFRLGLEPAIAWPLAGRTMLFDVVAHQWSTEILSAVGIKPSQLAKPLPSGAIVGTIPAELSQQLGLAEGAFVVTGGHDQPCAALGAGVTKPGTAVYATGTVECITPAFSEPVFSQTLQKCNLCTYDHTVPGMYTTVAFSLTGGNILKWFRDEFGVAEIEQARQTGRNPYELLLETAGNTPSDLLVLPYFTPSGTPYFDTTTRGAILGLQLSTKRAQLIRALLEGVALEMRLNLVILAECGCIVNELRAIGGGAQSDIWNQLKADVIGKQITVLDITEAGCLGVAMLARAADTSEPIVELARKWIKPISVKHPRPEFITHYENRFQTYRRLYPALRQLMPF